MKNHRTRFLSLTALVLLPLIVGGCRSRTDRSEGTVILSISAISVGQSVSLKSQTPPFLFDQISIRNVPKEPGNIGSSLEAVELRTLEIRYRRRDTGTRVPPPAVQSITGLVNAGATFTVIGGIGYLYSDQVLSPPLKDLIDFGRDTETGTSIIVLDVSVRVFGRTLSGDEIVSDPATFTIEVRP